MAYYITKIIISSLLIVAISEISKRSLLVGAILASVPLISVIAIIWLYHDTHNVTKISQLATSVFWLVIPSLALFISLPLLLKQGVHFYPSLAISIGITIACYWIMIAILKHFGITL